MKKLQERNLFLYISVCLLSILLAGCNPQASEVSSSQLTTAVSVSKLPTNMPTIQDPTLAPPHIHYSPPEGFNIYLEFDFPGSWIFSEYKEDENTLTLGFADPRFNTLPISADNPYPPPNDFGRIVIWVSPSDLGQTSDSELEKYMQGYSKEPMITELKGYKIKIDTYDAGVLEYKLKDIENHISTMFVRRMFLIINGQFHQIYYTVAEKERGGEFDQGYEYFFNSLKIVP